MEGEATAVFAGGSECGWEDEVIGGTGKGLFVVLVGVMFASPYGSSSSLDASLGLSPTSSFSAL